VLGAGLGSSYFVGQLRVAGSENGHKRSFKECPLTRYCSCEREPIVNYSHSLGHRSETAGSCGYVVELSVRLFSLHSKYDGRQGRDGLGSSDIFRHF
jgi:hypothetical protein